MRVSRHFINVRGTRIHYRRAGSGPPLIMVHQSPRSSSDFSMLMQSWGEHFTCIAPDTPGFGQSTPLPLDSPSIEDYAGALMELIDALGIERTAAYGFHSGSIILMTALRAHPERFSAVALGAYTMWTSEERAAFGDRYLPRFEPQPYGEHLAWLWNRVLEQSWFFPWYASDEHHRLAVAHDDVSRVARIVEDMLAAGDAFRDAYRAVLEAPRTLPAVDAALPPVLITAYDGDPLQEHLVRLGALPTGWSARPVATPAEHDSASLQFLRAKGASAPSPALPLDEDEGFVAVRHGGFDGLIHWRGRRGGRRIVLHEPGGSIDLASYPDALQIDLPAHGLSDDWAETRPDDLVAWAEVIAEAAWALGVGRDAEVIGSGMSALLALAVAATLKAAGCAGIAAHIPEDPAPWIQQAWPDLTPDRFGAYLVRAWGIARASACFWPWFEASSATAIPIEDGALSPERLALIHRSLVRAHGAGALGRALLTADRSALLRAAPRITRWDIANWVDGRSDLWKPAAAMSLAEPVRR